MLIERPAPPDAPLDAVPPQTSRRRTLPPWWPLVVLFGLQPLWWPLGLSNLIWAFAALPLAVAVFRRRGLIAPKGFGLWFLFLFWVLASATRLQGFDRWMAFTYRGVLYLSATLLALYLLSERRIGLARIIRYAAFFWAVVAVGGLVALAAPSFGFKSVLEAVLPGGLLKVPFIHALVHPQMAQEQRILGFPVGRPQAPFAYTNVWGSNFALLLPFAIMSLRTGTRRWRRVMLGLMAASIVPVIVSLNRGLWLSLGVGVLYAAVRFLVGGRPKMFIRVVTGMAVVVVVMLVTPLGGLFADRQAHPHSDKGREAMYAEAINDTSASPLLGYGAPLQSDLKAGGPSIGTHGQVWLVLVSQGVPGVVLFVGWLVAMAVVTARRGDEISVWASAVVVIAIVQLGFYEELPSQMHLVMLAVVVALYARRAGAAKAGLSARGA